MRGMKISTFERPFSELMKGMPEFPRTASEGEIAEMDLHSGGGHTATLCSDQGERLAVQ